MNEQNKEPIICQFYIVLGHHNRVFQNDEKSRYFKVTGNEDVNLIQYALAEEWKKKKKEHIKVANEIIFLIPDLSYQDLVKELMDKLNCRGKFQVLKPIRKDAVIPKKEQVENEKEKLEEKMQEEPIKKPLPPEKPQIEENIQAEIEKTIPKKDNIFHGDFPKKEIPNQKKETETKDMKDYMWGDEENNKLLSRKKEHKLDISVLIFIISALFLIGAVIILLILK